MIIFAFSLNRLLYAESDLFGERPTVFRGSTLKRGSHIVTYADGDDMPLAFSLREWRAAHLLTATSSLPSFCRL